MAKWLLQQPRRRGNGAHRHHLVTHVPAIDIFSIDTGRLHQETYDLLERLERRYRQVASASCTRTPQDLERAGQVARASTASTTASMRASPAARVRKVEPFKRAHRRLRSLGHRRAARAVRDARSGARVHRMGCSEWTAQGQSAARLERGAGVAIHPRAAAALQRTARQASSRASAASRARAPSSQARTLAPGVGGGSGLNRASVVCIRACARRSAKARFPGDSYGLPAHLHSACRTSPPSSSAAAGSALRKVELLRKAGARVTVVAPHLVEELRLLSTDGLIRHIEAAFEPRHLDGADVVIARNRAARGQSAVSRCSAERAACR